MANQEQLEILKSGVEKWNTWRKDNPDVRIDLSGANLERAKLNNADFRNADLESTYMLGAHLERVQLGGAYMYCTNLHNAFLPNANLDSAFMIGATLILTLLEGSDLSNATLTTANLSMANLRGAELNGAVLHSAFLDRAKLNRAKARGASLIGANLTDADLTEADLVDSNLSQADLSSAALNGIDIRGAVLDGTHFSNVDLGGVKNLAECNHNGPSSVDHRTLDKSKNIPKAFLRGVGFSDVWISYIDSLVESPIEFYSCFISYSHADKRFARRLHDQLQGRGIRCWLDEHQVLPGDKLTRVIDEGIKVWDKVLLCCSASSLSPESSWWVDRELDSAFRKEQRLQRKTATRIEAIIPLDLDGFFLSEDWEHEHKEVLRLRNAATFKGWETDNSIFEAQFERVVKALRTKDARPEPPEPKLGK